MTSSTSGEPVFIWLPNMRGQKQHIGVYGWSSTGTGIVAACDKEGIFLLEGSVEGLPKCKNCAAREAKADRPAPAPTDEWARPREVSDLLIAFPARVMDLMPDRVFCEEALRAMPDRGRQWIEFQRRWFSLGLPKELVVDLHEGVDGEMAFRQLKAIQGSFEPKHEHKEAGVAYLASRWFREIAYDGKLAGDDA